MAPKARILAIDDQLYFRSLIEGLLSDEGYSVQTAAGDVHARRVIEREGPFDLVIMDLVMPETDGVELVSELRERHPAQEVIVLTGIGDVRSVVSAMKRGAADYLLKPIDREGLLQSIGSVLEKRKLRQEHVRLVGENLEFMGRLSLFERAVPLLGLKRPLDVGRALLELVAMEARMRDGVLWLGSMAGSPLRRAVVCGETTLEEVPEQWMAAEETGAGLEAGQAVVLREPEPAFWLPCLHDDKLLAVLRLSAPEAGELPAASVQACEKLAEIGSLALANAFEVSELQQASLRDPRSGLPTRAFLERVAQTEIHKAHRFGRRLSCLCLEFGPAPESDEALQAVAATLVGSLRNSDIVAAESRQRFWVLVTDSDPLGGVVLKRRLAEGLGEALAAQGVEASVVVGEASYPLDGDDVEKLIQTAIERLAAERSSIVCDLGIARGTSLRGITEALLARAEPRTPGFVAEAAELVIGELSCRPLDRGLLFLAPGGERSAFLGPLAALGDSEAMTDVFLATDGDTIPSGPAVTALALPPEVPADTTWIVRFGEAPSYALLAGPRKEDRQVVFHSSDPVLVEHLAFRLRSEVGFGMRA